MTNEQMLAEWRHRNLAYWELGGIEVIAESYAEVVIAHRLGEVKSLAFAWSVQGYGGTDRANRRKIRGQVDAILRGD